MNDLNQRVMKRVAVPNGKSQCVLLQATARVIVMMNEKCNVKPVAISAEFRCIKSKAAIQFMDRPPSEKLTMRELAAALNTSATTVSRALRDDRSVALETRQKIQALAKELGYHVNPSVTALMSHVRASKPAEYRETLAWINCHARPDYFVNTDLLIAEYARKIWEGALERATQLGYTLEMFWMNEPGMNGSRLSRILATRGIRGILIPPFPRSGASLALDWSRFAVVSLTYTLISPQVHRVVPDHHANIRTVLNELKERGFEKVGLAVMAGHDERVDNRLVAPFYLYQRDVPARQRVPIHEFKLPTEKATGVWLKKWRPDVVVTLGGYRGFREIDIGDSEYSQQLNVVMVGCASYDVEAGFTALNENHYDIGSAGVDYLSGLLGRNEFGIPANPQSSLVKGYWMEGKTLSRPHAESCG